MRFAKISHFIGLLTLLLFAGSVSLSAVTLHQKQAKHFCQLLVCDNENKVRPLSAYIRQQPLEQNDSLSIEQLFATYVFDYEGWQTLRIFPHQKTDGTVVWYAPTDELPKDMSKEHQKYIREVFPRLITEIEAGNWDTVDAYIDRMIQYQCQFGGNKLLSRPSSVAIIGIFFLFFVISLLTFGILKKPATFL
jgi:hypothetical protein